MHGLMQPLVIFFPILLHEWGSSPADPAPTRYAPWKQQIWCSGELPLGGSDRKNFPRVDLAPMSSLMLKRRIRRGGDKLPVGGSSANKLLAGGSGSEKLLVGGSNVDDLLSVKVVAMSTTQSTSSPGGDHALERRQPSNGRRQWLPNAVGGYAWSRGTVVIGGSDGE